MNMSDHAVNVGQFIMSVINGLILLGTLGVVVWYTWETRKMQRKLAEQVDAANKQIEESKNQTRAMIGQGNTAAEQSALLARQIGLSILPAFTFSLFNKTSNEIMPHVTNIGNGVAFNIEFEPIDLHLETLSTGAGIRFHSLDYLGTDKYRFLSGTYNAGMINDSAITDANTENCALLKNGERDIKLSFCDIEGRRYRQTLHLKQGICSPGIIEPI